MKFSEIINVTVGECEGGLAELLRSEYTSLNELGITARWKRIKAPSGDFQAVADAMHNLGYGAKPTDRQFQFSAAEIASALLRGGEEMKSQLMPPQRDCVYILHDAQAAGLSPILYRQEVPVVWRHHLGTPTSNGWISTFWSALRPILEESAQLNILHDLRYRPTWMQNAFEVTPGINLQSHKNRMLDTSSSWQDFFDVYADLISVDHEKICIDSLNELTVGVSLSRWAPMKDPMTVLAVAETALKKTSKLAILMMGPNPSDPAAVDLYNRLLVARSSLPKRTKDRLLIGKIMSAGAARPDALVNELLSKAQIFLAFSIAEGFGLSVTEAMHHRMAVVARATGGIEQQLQKTGGGLIGHSETDLVNTLVRLTDDRDYRMELGKKGREGVRTHFDISTNIHRLLRAIDAVEVPKRVGPQFQ